MDSGLEMAAKRDSNQSAAKNGKEIDTIFRAAVKLGGSDVHLKVGRPPYVRVGGTLRALKREPIDDKEMESLCFGLLNERNRLIFEDEGSASFTRD